MSAPYGEDLAAIHAAGFTELAERAARELLAHLPRRARIAELGCGDGTSARMLADAGHDVYGIDLSPQFVALARQRVPEARFDVGSFRDAPLPRCDSVLAAGEVLGYVVDDRDDALDVVFERCASSLSAGGSLLFDLAGPGRPTGSSRTEGAGWVVLAHTTVGAGILTRRIVRSDARTEPGAVARRRIESGFTSRATCSPGSAAPDSPHGRSTAVTTVRRCLPESPRSRPGWGDM